MEAVIVYCTCPSADVAGRLARALVEERLAACVNRIPYIASTYLWKGEVCRDSECLLLIKTMRERFDALRARIVELHPYELAEVIAVDIALGLTPYLDWIASETIR